MIVVLTYFVICLTIGCYNGRNIKTVTQFAIGDKRIATNVLVISTFSTFIGAGATLGAIDKVYSLGIIFSATLLFEVLSWVLTYKIFAKNINQFKGCVSLSEIMGALYGNYAWWVTSIVTILQGIGIVSAQVFALTSILEYFYDIPSWMSISLGFGVLVTYSTFGGMKSITMTDVFQFSITCVAIPTACAIAYYKTGGYVSLLDKLPHSYTHLNLHGESIWLFVSLAFYSLLPHTESTFIQKFLMSSDRDQIVKSLKTVALITIPFIFFLTIIGLTTRFYYPNLPANTVFFYFISYLVPTGIKGLFIIGILSIILSTADSWLNTSAVCLSHNIAKKIFPTLTDKQELLIARASTFILGFLAVLLSLQGEGFLELIWLADNFWHPLILTPLIAGFLGFKINSKSFMLSTIIALFFTCLSAYIDGKFSTFSILFGVIGSTLGLLVGYFFQVNKRAQAAIAMYTSKLNAIKNRIYLSILHLYKSFL